MPEQFLRQPWGSGVGLPLGRCLGHTTSRWASGPAASYGLGPEPVLCSARVRRPAPHHPLSAGRSSLTPDPGFTAEPESAV